MMWNVMNMIVTCPIWGHLCNAEGTRGRSRGDPIFVKSSERAGGGYRISNGDVEARVQQLADAEKARLTTWLIDQRSLGNGVPEITLDVVNDCRNKSLSNEERAIRLLRYLAGRSRRVGDSVRWSADGAFAWSESTEHSELRFLVETLIGNGWLTHRGSEHVEVTADGYAHVAEQKNRSGSAQAFVAMWFGKSMNDIYETGFKSAIQAAGYRALRIDRKPDLNKIDDDIINEICGSKFVIADFTHGRDGARGSVYYEAGFAHGLGKPVIFTCRADMIGKLHFDIRQYWHIKWERENLGEFRGKLKEVILARIGEGPGMDVADASG